MNIRILLAGLLALAAAPALAQSQSVPAVEPAPAATAAPTPSAPPAPPSITDGTAAPLPEGLDPENIWYLDLSTGGRVTIRLRPEIAPKTVERIRTLTRRGFYNGLIFHRVIDGFMAQTGDPTGTGQGGSDLPNLPPEFSEAPHVRGAVSMARAEGLDSANSQFFIMFQPLLRLDHNYTVFGRVIAGMQWVDKIARGEPPAEPSRILQASIAADHVPPPDFAALPAAGDANLLSSEAAKLGGSQTGTPAPADARAH